MSPDPLNLSQRETLDAALNKQARTMASRNLRVADEMEAHHQRAIRAWTVAFLSLCLAAICLMLFVRVRYGVKSSDLTIDNGTAVCTIFDNGTSNCPLFYCAKKNGEWLCEYDPKKLEEEVEPEPTVFGTQPEKVEL